MHRALEIGTANGAIAIAALSIAAFAFCSSAEATTASAAFSSSAAVVGQCSISSTPLAFGTYDPVTANASSPLDGTATITIACTRGTTATVGLDGGAHTSGTVRRMQAGADFLTYELFQDANRLTVWTNSGTGTLNVVSTSSAPRAFTVFGRIAGGQDAAAGAYSDTIITTVNY
jgi:spore coat protein U-like protein